MTLENTNNDEYIDAVQQISRPGIYDTEGKYLGEFTGTNDAQTLIDALSNRNSGASIILPTVDFDLDWEQGVDLPEERGFSLYTTGMNTIVPQSGYTDNFVLRMRNQAGNKDNGRFKYIGPLRIANENNISFPDGVIHVVAHSRSIIEGVRVTNTSGFWYTDEDPNGTSVGSSHMEFKNCWVSTFDDNAFAFKLEVKGGTFIQDPILTNCQLQSGTGADNSLLEFYGIQEPRIENLYVEAYQGGVVADFNGVWDYDITTQDFDRADDVGLILREQFYDDDGGNRTAIAEKMSFGKLEVPRQTDNFKSVRIGSQATKLTRTNNSDPIAGGDSGILQNYFDGINEWIYELDTGSDLPNKLTHIGPDGTSDFASEDSSYGGQLRVNAFGVAGNESTTQMPTTFRPEVWIPKLGYETFNVDSTGVLYQIGFANPSTPTDNRCEMVWDPDNVLSTDGTIGAIGSGDHPNDSVYFELVSGGVVRDSMETKETSPNNFFGINYHDASWAGVAGGFDTDTTDTEMEISEGGSPLGDVVWRTKVYNTDGNGDKFVDYRFNRGGITLWHI